MLFGQHGVDTSYVILEGLSTNIYQASTLTGDHHAIMKPSPRSQRHHVATNTRVSSDEVELLDTAHMHHVEHFSAIRESNATKFTDISSQGGICTTCDMDYRGRILRAIGTPCYTPLTVQLAINPDSLVTMVKQMIDCGFLGLLNLCSHAISSAFIRYPRFTIQSSNLTPQH